MGLKWVNVNLQHFFASIPCSEVYIKNNILLISNTVGYFNVFSILTILAIIKYGI
jgi:hypothetical protein